MYIYTYVYIYIYIYIVLTRRHLRPHPSRPLLACLTRCFEIICVWLCCAATMLRDELIRAIGFGSGTGLILSVGSSVGL